MIIDRDERWTFGHALHLEVDPTPTSTWGSFMRNTLYSKITLNGGTSNWVLASIPTPNVTKGWKISSTMLRFAIRGTGPEFGIIDKIGVRDGPETVFDTEVNVDRLWGGIVEWKLLVLDYPQPMPFKNGLGVSIHVNYPVKPTDPSWPSFPPTEFLFASVGLGFVKESVIVPPIETAPTTATTSR